MARKTDSKTTGPGGEAPPEDARADAVLSAINRVFRERINCETEEELAGTCLAVAEEVTGSKFGFLGELNAAGLFDTLAISNPGWDACRVPGSEATKITKNKDAGPSCRHVARRSPSGREDGRDRRVEERDPCTDKGGRGTLAGQRGGTRLRRTGGSHIPRHPPGHHRAQEDRAGTDQVGASARSGRAVRRSQPQPEQHPDRRSGTCSACQEDGA